MSGAMSGTMSEAMGAAMSVAPLLEEQGGTPLAPGDRRFLSIYPAASGFDLVEELEHLNARAIEPNLFFNPRFLAPAMPRLDDRDVRLAVIRDGNEAKSRLRFLVPFTVERAAPVFGVPVVRTWSSPFGPLGTPLVDGDDPAGVIRDFLDMLARPHLHLPRVLVLPEVRLDGPFASLVARHAEAHGLPLALASRIERPHLLAQGDAETYLRGAISGHHFRGIRRLKRRLAEQGQLDYTIAREPEDVRLAIETFLALEASGWKGRARTAMAIDRYRAAFLREAAQRLGEQGICQVHQLTLSGKPLASLVIFVEAGVAYTWKTAYDENFAQYSPGMLLMVEATRSLIEDPAIDMADSCAVPDHPVMSRLWRQRRPLGTMIIGLTPDTAGQVGQAASQLGLYRQTRNAVRILRGRVKRAFGRS